MFQEVVSTVMSAGDIAVRGSIQTGSIQTGSIKVSKSAVLANLAVSGTLSGSAFVSAGGGAISGNAVLNNLTVNQDATVDGTLDAGNTVIIGQTAADVAKALVVTSATLQLGPAWRIVGTDSSIDVHFSPDFINFTKVATLVQLED